MAADRGEDPGALVALYADELGLDDETLTTIQEIISSTHERGRALRFEREEAHRRLNFMLSLDEPDETEVLDQAVKIGRIRIEESKHRLSTLLRIRTLLTPEQRRQLAELQRRAPREQQWRDARTACEGDIQRLCPDAARGRETHECMREHRDELSEGCSTATQELRRRGGPPRGH